MREIRPKPRAVSGVVAPSPKPTVLGAAVMATLVTFPIGVAVLVAGLL